MQPDDIRAARLALNLTQAQLGRLLETDGQTIRRMELDPSASTFRKPAVRMERLIRIYLSGYRTPDWPVTADVAVIE
jgi:DNA-binding transcriptional regulator YiaG